MEPDCCVVLRKRDNGEREKRKIDGKKNRLREKGEREQQQFIVYYLGNKTVSLAVLNCLVTQTALLGSPYMSHRRER